MRTVLVAALMVAAPALAQKAPPPVVVAPTPPAAATATPAAPPTPVVFAVTPIPPTDPVRLAAARPVIDKMWPRGSYARLMHVLMGPVMQDSMARTFNMKPGDLLPGLDAKATKPGAKADVKPGGGETLGQMAAKGDPYFQQRMALTMNAVGDEMARVMTQLEPEMRDAIAHAYARRFTVAELGELDRFFATPIGRAYAADQYTLMMSPDMTVAMQGFVPRLVKEAPEMMARVAAATKDLPPPPGKATKTAPAPIAPVPPPAKKP